ncbi:unnamed protein product [Gongylonema pulchrum]|uniref:Capsid protein n=1 Tax=Gongylonema pulchrum TaxID=637853 RepID=A0A183DVB6_9BILA|nr:unnamed protein product [Gongylonema pulchrum]
MFCYNKRSYKGTSCAFSPAGAVPVKWCPSKMLGLGDCHIVGSDCCSYTAIRNNQFTDSGVKTLFVLHSYWGTLPSITGLIDSTLPLAAVGCKGSPVQSEPSLATSKWTRQKFIYKIDGCLAPCSAGMYKVGSSSALPRPTTFVYNGRRNVSARKDICDKPFSHYFNGDPTKNKMNIQMPTFTKRRRRRPPPKGQQKKRTPPPPPEMVNTAALAALMKANDAFFKTPDGRPDKTIQHFRAKKPLPKGWFGKNFAVIF